jgi:glycosyltransferase involved in cell wall biosynthesis
MLTSINQKKIKVLHLTSTLRGIGGVQNLLLALGDKYDREHFEFFFCNLFDDARGKGLFPTTLKEKGHNYIKIPERSFWELPVLLFKLVKAIRREQFDIVHTHMLQASIIGQLIAKFMHLPAVLTRHYSDYVYLYKGRFYQWLDRFAAHLAEHIIAISEGSKKILVEYDKVRPEKISVIYNGIDLHKFDCLSTNPSLKQEFFPDDARIIGTVAELHPCKGHRFLLQAAMKIIAQCPTARFLIVGDGILRSELENLATQLGLENYVYFTGWRADVPQLLQCVDVYAHPSVEEGFGIAIIEAMAMRKPVVASRVGGIPEVVEDDVTGLLVPPENPDALATGILRYLSDPVLAKHAGEQGRERVEKKFTVERMTENYQAVYLACLQRKTRLKYKG